MAKRWKLGFVPVVESAAPLLVHGHCHQKAVGAMKSVRKVLKLIPGLEFSFIESTCCGGAGSFYLEAEHATHADAMADQGLLPTLRESPATRVMANGFACRQQITDGSGNQPIHLAVLLAERLP
jgi:glycerol-3-phosphate dehydrogenase subunit C